MQSGLRILIWAPQVPFSVPPKMPKMGHLIGFEWLTATGGRLAAGAQVGGGIEATERPRNTRDTVHMFSYAENSRTQDKVRMG